MKADILHDALCSLFSNGEVNEEDFQEYAQHLIDKGDDIDDALIEACEEQYPDNAVLLELLRNAQVPLIKGVEC